MTEFKNVGGGLNKKTANNSGAWWQISLWAVSIFFIVLYTYSGFHSQKMLGILDGALDPIIYVIKNAGVDIRSPFMDGKLSESFYIHLANISVLGAILFNFFSVISYFRQSKLSKAEEVEQRMKKINPNWSRFRTWLTACLVPFFLLIYCIACFLNGINGWIVFHINEAALIVMWAVVFLLLPGSIITVLVFSVVNFVLIGLKKFTDRGN